jgi:hypothetical protein
MEAMPTPSKPVHSMRVMRDVRVPMRDGVHVAVDVYLPDGDGPFPALYAVSPYQKDTVHLPAIPAFRFRETGRIDWWVARGYAYVHADVRGTGSSTEGVWRVFDEVEQRDMYDTIEWIAAQPWCTGKVGMIGESYYGIAQWFAAAQQPPHLACIAPYDAAADLYRDVVYHGGLLSMGFLTWWHFDTRARNLLNRPGPHPENIMAYDMVLEILRHPLYDDLWRERTVRFDRIKVPVFSIGNWKTVGLHLRGNLLGFEQVNTPKKLLVNAGKPLPDPDPHASQRIFDSLEMHETLLRWYDYWLKGVPTGVMDEPAVTYVVQQGGGVRTGLTWPPTDVEYRPLYLRRGPAKAAPSLNDGALSWEPPTTFEPPTSIRYPDPEWVGWPGLGVGVFGKRGLPNPVRKVLTFTTPPLKEDLEVTGPIVLHLWLASDQTDTDVYVTISDQLPGLLSRAVSRMLDVGPPAVAVTRGWLKASHRRLDPVRSTEYRPFHPHTEPEPLEPGRPTELVIEVWPTSWVFRRGHRIRLQIAPGDSPLLDPFPHHYNMKQGTDTIFHDVERRSHLLLPVRV